LGKPFPVGFQKRGWIGPFTLKGPFLAQRFGQLKPLLVGPLLGVNQRGSKVLKSVFWGVPPILPGGFRGGGCTIFLGPPHRGKIAQKGGTPFCVFTQGAHNSFSLRFWPPFVTHGDEFRGGVHTRGKIQPGCVPPKIHL